MVWSRPLLVTAAEWEDNSIQDVRKLVHDVEERAQLSKCRKQGMERKRS